MRAKATSPDGPNATDARRARILEALAVGDHGRRWRDVARLVHDSDDAARSANHLQRVAHDVLKIAERHGPIAGPVRPAQKPASVALDHVQAQIEEIDRA